jgi:hypothetical protein
MVKRAKRSTPAQLWLAPSTVLAVVCFGERVYWGVEHEKVKLPQLAVGHPGFVKGVAGHSERS